jgi:hypothetical protein
MNEHKIPPNSVEAEQALLGAILWDNTVFTECLEIIGPDDFYGTNHKLIYEYMRDLHEGSGSFDQVVLCDCLRNAGVLDKVGGPSYVSQLVDNVLSAANATNYARIVKDKSLRRAIITAASDMTNKAYANNGEATASVLDFGKSSLNRIVTEDGTPLLFKNAATWLDVDPLPADQIIENIFDAGDKVAIIGSSKLMKSFFLQQALLCFAAGRPLFDWRIPKPRRCCHIQYEVKEHHYHRRLRRLAAAMNIQPSDLGDRLHILNARGLGLTGPAGLEKIKHILYHLKPQIISFDPLYKVADGIENAAESMKVILNAFDELAEATGAAIQYVHHDAKGSPGDRDIRDRGAGSNVLGRDYDACFTLTAHASDPDAIVIETLLRNYKPQEPFTIQFMEDETTGGYKFELRPDILATKKTSANAKQAPSLDVYLPVALEILNNEIMEINLFKAELKKKAGISDHRVKGFVSWVTAGGNPKLETRQERGRGKNEKWIGAPDVFNKHF